MLASLALLAQLGMPPPTATPTAASSAAPTATPTACAEPNREVRVLHAVPPKFLPLGAMDDGQTRQALVLVTVDDKGVPTSVEIYRSSGNSALDDVAMNSARSATYSPKAKDCVPISGGQYIFAETFRP